MQKKEMQDTIYFDHQATTPMDRRVLQAMLPYFRAKFGNPHAADHVIGWKSSRAVAEASERIAALIGADPDEVIFTSGATEANNLALLGLACRRTNRRRNRVLVSAIEHKSVFAVAGALHSRFGYVVETVPVDAVGRVAIADLEAMLDDTVLAVSVVSVNNEIGTIQDLRRLSDSARSVGAIFHSDSAQAPLAMDLRALGQQTDLASLSGHKMLGPPGIGVLYVRRALQDRLEPTVYGGGQQNGLRSGTLPLPLCVGLGAAAEILRAGSDFRTALSAKRDRFVERLRELSWRITVNGPRAEDRHPGNANLCFHGFSAHDILNVLQPALAASTGSACTAGVEAPSHVLRAIGISSDDANSSIRFSLGCSTQREEVDIAVGLVSAALERLSGPKTVRSDEATKFRYERRDH